MSSPTNMRERFLEKCRAGDFAMDLGDETDGSLYFDEDKIAAFIESELSAQEVRAEKERWCAPCPGCKDGHPSFWKTVVQSPQWEAWYKYQMKNQTYDIDESQECGVLSPGHFQDFLKFVTTLSQPGDSKTLQ